MIDYPPTLREAEAWARQRNMRASEARRRFAQAGILAAVSESRTLREDLYFKGGNALDFVWCPNRSTLDLDFSCRETAPAGSQLRALFEVSLGVTSRRIGTLYKVQRFEQQPPGADKTFITYDVSIGYALEDDRMNRMRLSDGKPSRAAVSLDVSLNDPVCDFELVQVRGGEAIQVCTLEDIIAEKYRALLQQPIRKRNRPQDVLDIAVVLRCGRALRPEVVARFLQTKAAARGITPAKHSLLAPEVREMARLEYERLEGTTRAQEFVAFDEAFALVLGFYLSLPLPAFPID